MSNITEPTNTNALFHKVKEVIEQSRKQIVTTINSSMVCTYFAIGYYIVENEQKGKIRAEYGKSQLIELSQKLTETYGKGWSVENLTLFRKFYSIYSTDWLNQSTETSSLQDTNFVNTVYDFQNRITLTWSHYLVLMRIENPKERHFYEIEAKNQCWSVRQLNRQYNSSLYERLALSRNKQEVMNLIWAFPAIRQVGLSPLSFARLFCKLRKRISAQSLTQECCHTDSILLT